MKFAKLGSIFYIAWGLLHIKAAYDEFLLGASLENGLVQGKINQGAWDLMMFALASILIAILLNWKNDRLGYWLNLAVVSAADIGFILFVLLPGRVAFFSGILGPVFWILAAIFSTIGIRSKTTSTGWGIGGSQMARPSP
jgi:hypothetical protein